MLAFELYIDKMVRKVALKSNVEMLFLYYFQFNIVLKWLQIIEFCFLLHFTQHHTIFGNRIVYIEISMLGIFGHTIYFVYALLQCCLGEAIYFRTA